MKMYVVDLVCGCCTETLYFSSDEAIQAAFNEVGLTSNATITDECGITVDGIDTFYGWRHEEVEETRGKLERLFDRI